MADRSILITGCSSGIGLAAARTLRKSGWRVFASVRRPEDVAPLEALGLEALQLDYSDPGSIEDALDRVLHATGGTLFALFNNGGYGQPGAVEDLPTDALRAQFETNVFGQHDLTRRIVPVMRRGGEGRIVFCSSLLGLVSAPYRGAYCASKFALEALADALRMELKGSGVYVSLIEPGPIRTRFIEHALEAYRRAIDFEASPHRDIYRQRIAKMEQGGDQTFKLGPEAVVDRLISALDSKLPRARYFVTLPTHIGAGLRRVLPTRALDAVMRRN